MPTSYEKFKKIIGGNIKTIREARKLTLKKKKQRPKIIHDFIEIDVEHGLGIGLKATIIPGDDKKPARQEQPGRSTKESMKNAGQGEI